MISCNDSLEEGDNIPDFDGCLGCSKYDECNNEIEIEIEIEIREKEGY